MAVVNGKPSLGPRMRFDYPPPLESQPANGEQTAKVPIVHLQLNSQKYLKMCGHPEHLGTPRGECGEVIFISSTMEFQRTHFSRVTGGPRNIRETKNCSK